MPAGTGRARGVRPLQVNLCRFETKQGRLNNSAGILDGWIAFILVWAAVIATLVAIVAALLGSAE